jgi:formylglycine-generating enzyme required for sulfatase activity
MGIAAKYLEQAKKYDALALATKSPNLRIQYEELARECRILAETAGLVEANRRQPSDAEIESLAERMTDTKSKL